MCSERRPSAAPALSMHVAHTRPHGAQRNGRRRPAVAPRRSALSFFVGVAGSHSRGRPFLLRGHGIDEESGVCLRTLLGLRLAPWVEPGGRRPRREQPTGGRTCWREGGASTRSVTYAGSVSHRAGRHPRSERGEASAGGASHLHRQPGAGEPPLGRRFLGPGCGLATRREHPPDGPGGRRLLATRRRPHRPQSGSPDEGVMSVTPRGPSFAEGAPRGSQRGGRRGVGPTVPGSVAALSGVVVRSGVAPFTIGPFSTARRAQAGTGPRVPSVAPR